MIKLFVEEYPKKDQVVIMVSLIELTNFKGKRKDQVNIRSQLEIKPEDVINLMKEQHYQNVFWNLRGVYNRKYFMNNYYDCMLEQFDEQDNIEINMDYIVESLLGYDVSLLLLEDDLYEGLLCLVRLIFKVLYNYIETEHIRCGGTRERLDYIYNSKVLDKECERHPESDPFLIK